MNITAELFDALLNNRLVGQLAVGDAFHESVFDRAVKRGLESSTLVAELFQSRLAVLLGEIIAEHCVLSTTISTALDS